VSEPTVSDADATTPAIPANPLARPGSSGRGSRTGSSAGAAARGNGRNGEEGGQISLGERLRQPRTLVSLGVPLVLLVLIFRVALNVDFAQLAASVAGANKLLLLAAFIVFYAGFPIRGYRWSMLLRGAGIRVGTKDATEVLFLSWTVNCLVPAKLGDLYRAFLLKINADVSGSRTLGTIFIERVLDLFAIAIMGLAAGFWSFRTGFPPEIQFVALLGIAVVVVLAGLLFAIRNFGRAILHRLPLPESALAFYDRFEEGLFSINRRSVGPLVLLTMLIWTTEGLRLWLVVQALGLPGVSLGISGAFFVAFIGSLLTAVPLSPAGLGIVELGVVGVLVAAYGLPVTEATTIALVDRLISVFSIIVIGTILYLVSPIRRGAGLSQPAEVTAPAG
jgi:glycosyltransferase 2 family protein